MGKKVRPMVDKKDENLEELSPEEQKAEEEALKSAEVKEDELREKIAEEMELDPDDEAEGELIDKIFEREKKSSGMLSGAIRQKRKYRTALEKLTSDKKSDEDPAGETPEEKDASEGTAMSEEKFQEKMEARDLEELDLPEEIETEVKDIAKAKGISVREAVKLPYIVSVIKEFDEEERLKDATPKRNKKGSVVTSVDPSKALNPADFALDTEEGQKAWKEAKTARRAHLNKEE